MKKLFAIAICLAILAPSISFGITQEQYLLLVAKSLYNQVEKLKKESYYANIFSFMNKKKIQTEKKTQVQNNVQAQKRVEAQKKAQLQKKVQLQNGDVKFECVEREIADKIVARVEKEFPEKAKLIDRDNQKTILWRCMVVKDTEVGDIVYNSLLHCRENCGFKNIPGVRVNHTDTEVLSVEISDITALPVLESAEPMLLEEGFVDTDTEMIEKDMIGTDMMEEEFTEEDTDPGTIEDVPVVTPSSEVRWAIGQDGFCRKAENGKYSNYGDCIKEAKVRPVQKEAKIKQNVQRKTGFVNWFMGALGLR